MTKDERFVILASSLGTVFEWYDFYLYGSLAAIIAKQFFAGLDPTSAFIFALLAFAWIAAAQPAPATTPAAANATNAVANKASVSKVRIDGDLSQQTDGRAPFPTTVSADVITFSKDMAPGPVQADLGRGFGDAQLGGNGRGQDGRQVVG